VKHLAVLFVSIFLAAVAAVGISATDPPAAEAASGGYVPRCGGGEIFLRADERYLFARHNQVRRNHGLRAFCVHPALQKAARAHTSDMIRRDYFSHYTKGTNKGPCESIRSYGYRYRYCAENIGYNSTPASLFDAWMRSSGHRGNILDGKFREIGIGAGYENANLMKSTVDFGTRL